MSTTPTPVPTTVTLFSSISGYLKAHEFLLLCVLGIALTWGVVGKVENWELAHDQNVYNAKVAQLQAMADKNAQQAAVNKQIADANAALAAQYQQAAASAQAANAQLEQATATLLAAVKQAKAADAKLPTPELGTRIATLAKVPAATITANKDDSLTVQHDGAVGIAQALEDLPVLNKEVENLNQEKANLGGQIAKQDELVAGLNKQVLGQQTEIGGLNLQLKQADGVCQAQIKVVKDTERKRTRKRVVIAYVAGLITGIFGAHAAGI